MNPNPNPNPNPDPNPDPNYLQEREWLTTVRALLNELRTRCAEVQAALKELDEVQGEAGWRPASDTMGVKTEWKVSRSRSVTLTVSLSVTLSVTLTLTPTWKVAEDSSLWIRMEGELTGASLVHAAAVAYEVDLWPRWVPLCPQAEVRPRARYNPLPCDNPSQCYNPSPCYRPLTTLPTPNHATDPSRAAPRWQCLARQKPSPCYGPVACHPPPWGLSPGARLASADGASHVAAVRPAHDEARRAAALVARRQPYGAAGGGYHYSTPITRCWY